MSTDENNEPIYLPLPSEEEVDQLVALFEELWLKQPSDDEMRMHISEFDSHPSEVKIDVWRRLMTLNSDKSVSAKALWFHRWLAASLVTGVFGVPMGQAGVGTKPKNIVMAKPK